MGWGKFEPANDATFTIAENILKHDNSITPELSGIAINAKWQNAQAVERQKKEYLNKVPTHDPYTNPDATIYYECGCGAILDPNTKSFAALNNHASEKGWKIRFTDKGYVPYCVKCGKGVE